MEAADVVRRYKVLQEVLRGFRNLKQFDLRPAYYRRKDRIVAHVQLCWLALLLMRWGMQNLKPCLRRRHEQAIWAHLR